MYLHERKNWWRFQYDNEKILNLLGKVRAQQGLMLGRMTSIGFDFQNDAMLTTMSLELVRSSEIEGEFLNFSEVRSSIARRLGINAAGLVPSSRYVEGVVEMLLDATQNYNQSLSDERLFGWHNVLFPTGRSGLYEIEVGKYRTGEMQVISGAMGKERVHYQAPKPERLAEEMGILEKNRFWERNKDVQFNERQRRIINMLFDDFFGKLTSGKWAKIAKCSNDTALNDLKDLLAKGILVKNEEGGRSTNYSLVV
jgi:Fic family protein